MMGRWPAYIYVFLAYSISRFDAYNKHFFISLFRARSHFLCPFSRALSHIHTDYLHKKQSGGSGQYGGVKGYIEPLPADHPVKNEFKNAIIGTIIPQEFIPAIEKGFFEVWQPARATLALTC